jgi:hypothetical protein
VDWIVTLALHTLVAPTAEIVGTIPEFTATVIGVEVDLQPFASVPTTVKVPEDVTVKLLEVELLDHK